MTAIEKKTVREKYLKKVIDLFNESGEDVGMINPHTINFPIVYNGEESTIEIVVKIPTYDGDELYAKRDEYQMHLAENEAKQKKAQKDKAKKN